MPLSSNENILMIREARAMLNRHQRPQLRPTATLIKTSLVLTLTIVFFLLPASASAHTTLPIIDGPTLQVNAGFNARYRDGNWIPVQVTLSNNGADFSGTLSISVPAPFAGQGNTTLSSHYREPITLANGAQKQVTIDVPLNTGSQGGTQTLTIRLLDDSGNVVRTQTSSLSSLGTNDVFVGVLSDQNTGFGPLYGIALPNQGGSMIVEALNASTMPDTAAVLRNFDLIVLDNFTTSTLSHGQLTALQTWVNQGGGLIEVGGPEWRRTLSVLPASLLPVSINGTSILPADTHLLPVGTSTETGQTHRVDSVHAPVTVSTATLVQGNSGNAQITTILASDKNGTGGTIPLIVQAHQGQGTICYLAYDPTLDPIISWSGANTLWRSLALRTLGDKLLNSNGNFALPNTFQTGGLSGLLQNLLSNALPSPWLLLVLLLSYLIVLGPIRLLIVRWRKRRDWSWRIVLASIVVFSLLAYGLAIQQKGTAILSNSVSMIRLNQGGSSAHITTYVGVFVPNQGDYNVHIPGNGLVQPSPDQQYDAGLSASGQQTTVIPGQNGTDVDLQGVNIWTLRSLLAEGDQQVHGGIDSHLTLQNGILTGTVTNRLSYGLSDVYVLMTNSFVALGHISAGQTVQVKLPLNTLSANSGTTLADQMASSKGLPTPYGDIAGSGGLPIQNGLQRHLAILSALSDSAFPFCGQGPCNVSAPASGYVVGKRGGIFFGGGSGGGVTNGGDPLLVPDSPVTLIGWADGPTDVTSTVTVNGATPSGLQETLIQAPLSVNLGGTLNLPANFINAQLVEVQGKNVQIQPANAYTMTTGSVTFEFVVPNSTELQVSNFTISEPSNLPQVLGQPIAPGSTSVVYADRLQAYLHNWRTGAWDSIVLSNYSFSTANPDPYIGPGGRILLQLANQDNSIGTILFGKPSLDLQGSAR